MYEELHNIHSTVRDGLGLHVSVSVSDSAVVFGGVYVHLCCRS